MVVSGPTGSCECVLFIGSVQKGSGCAAETGVMVNRPAVRRSRQWLRVWTRYRDMLRQRPVAGFVYRVVVGVVGMVVLAVGIVAIPYPGPGWAIVFLGLAILATEFAWAYRVLVFTRDRYRRFVEWFRSQGLVVQIMGVLFTTAVVVATLWVFGALGWVAHMVGVDYPVLQSPIF